MAYSISDAQWEQFKNPNSAYTNTFEGDRSQATENQPFAFPLNSRHNISNLNRNSQLQKLESRVVRGFMRSIVLGGDLAKAFLKDPKATNKNLRLNFQFNPEYIERRVSQSPGAVNPLLQDPAALTQSVPGTAQFNFTMMFNREAEVAQYTEKSNLLGTDVDLTDAFSDPGRVGVMHDLSIFDRIIGQGISKDLIQILTRYTEQQNVALSNSKNEEIKKNALSAEDLSASIGNIGINVGNSAFLNPMPVRIVFSDLFMVEGLVVSSAVAFQKFSQNMIPTICQVNCELYALYVGFAQKDAFLSTNLKTWADDIANTTDANEKKVKTTKDLYSKKLGLVAASFNHRWFDTEPQSDLLSVPNAGTDAAKVLTSSVGNKLAVNPSTYYDSSNSGTYVTVSQWVNEARAKNGKVEIYNGSTNVTGSVQQAFQINQSVAKKGHMPVTFVIKYQIEAKSLPEEIKKIEIINVKLINGTASSPKRTDISISGGFDNKDWKYVSEQNVAGIYQNSNDIGSLQLGTTKPGKYDVYGYSYFKTQVWFYTKPFVSSTDAFVNTQSTKLSYQIRMSGVSKGDDGTELPWSITSSDMTAYFKDDILYYVPNGYTTPFVISTIQSPFGTSTTRPTEQ